MREIRDISKKNYFILGGIIVITIFLLYYFSMWVDVYKDSVLSISILDKYMTVINYNELDNYLVENPNSIVYVSKLGSADIRKFEIQLKSSYRENLIDKDILYMDITDELKDGDLVLEMNEKYYVNKAVISDVPCVVVFNEGRVRDIYNINLNDDISVTVNHINEIKFSGEES